MTIVRVLFPGLWETSWPKYVWFRKMNVYTLNSLHYLSNQQHLLRPRYSFVGRGAGGQRVAVWAKRQLTLQTTTYNTKSTIDDSYKILFGEPVGWGGGVHVPVTVWKLRVFNSRLHVWWRRRLWLCYWYSNFFYSFPHFSQPKTLYICPSSTRCVQCLKKLYFSLSFGQTALTFCSSEATFGWF